MQRHRIAGLDAGQPSFLKVGGYVKHVGVIHAQQRDAGRREISQMPVKLDDNARKRRANHRVPQLVLRRRKPALGLLDHFALENGQVFHLLDLVLSRLR